MGRVWLCWVNGDVLIAGKLDWTSIPTNGNLKFRQGQHEPNTIPIIAPHCPLFGRLSSFVLSEDGRNDTDTDITRASATKAGKHEREHADTPATSYLSSSHQWKWGGRNEGQRVMTNSCVEWATFLFSLFACPFS